MLTLLYLSWRSLRGRGVGWLRLIKQPKYLVGTLVGIAWMGLFALRPILRVNRRAELAIVWKNLMIAHRTNLCAAVATGVVTVGLAAMVVRVTGLPDWL